MELLFRNLGLKYSIESIMLFSNDADTWLAPLFVFYPQMNKTYFQSLNENQRQSYLYETLEIIYRSEEQAILNKVERYNQHWDKHKKQVIQALSEAFQIDCDGSFNNIVANITLNPVCPRFLDKQSFDIFYLNSEKGALGMALHEIIHFVWFFVWQQRFHDNISEYEKPHLKWIFSEMVVDPIMRNDNRLKDINPYFNEGCAYECFYHMIIDGKPILETFYTLYKNMNIINFMEEGYAYCQKHEPKIREQMGMFIK